MLLVCGDIITNSREDPIHQVRLTVDKLDKVNTGLKFIIAGNNDKPLDPNMAKGKGHWSEQRQTMLQMFKEKNITYLNEGRHEFVLDNGARLRLYSSPRRPNAHILAKASPTRGPMDIACKYPSSLPFKPLLLPSPSGLGCRDVLLSDD